MPAGPFHYAFHFDQALVGAWLRSKARGIRHIDAQVTGVEKGGEGVAALHLDKLAELTTRANFDAAEPVADEVAAASSASRFLRSSITGRVTFRRRALRALDPRPLLPRAQLRG